MMRVKARSGVESSSSAPIRPPATLSASSVAVETLSSARTSRRYAHELASVPGNSATVLEAFAIVGGNPARVSAGKLTNVPPPATAFIAPAIKPAPASIASKDMRKPSADEPMGAALVITYNAEHAKPAENSLAVGEPMGAALVITYNAEHAEPAENSLLVVNRWSLRS